MKDLISRTLVIEDIDKAIQESEDTIEKMQLSRFRDYIKLVPACCKWIPCTDRLPEETGFYITTKKIVETGKHFVNICFFYKETGWSESSEYIDIIAWQPRPDPYLEDI